MIKGLALKLGPVPVILLLAVALLGLFWTPYDPADVMISMRLQPPSSAHWLGTDHLGRDLLSMIMAGASVTLGVAAMAVGIGVIFGVPLGLMAAARRGHFIDDLILRGNDLIFAFPALLTAILITARFGPGAVNAMLAIGIFNIPVFARVTRSAHCLSGNVILFWWRGLPANQTAAFHASTCCRISCRCYSFRRDPVFTGDPC